MTAARPWSVPAGTLLVVTAASLALLGSGVAAPDVARWVWLVAPASSCRGSSPCRVAARTVAPGGGPRVVGAARRRAWRWRRGPWASPVGLAVAPPWTGALALAVAPLPAVRRRVLVRGGPGWGLGSGSVVVGSLVVDERLGLGCGPVVVPAGRRPSAPLGARRHVPHRPLGRARPDGGPAVPDGAGGPVPLPLVLPRARGPPRPRLRAARRRDPPAAADPPPRLRRDGGAWPRGSSPSTGGARRPGPWPSGRSGPPSRARGPGDAASPGGSTPTAPASTPSGSTGSTRRARPSAGSRRSGSSPWRRGCSGAVWRPVTSCSSSCSGCWRPGRSRHRPPSSCAASVPCSALALLTRRWDLAASRGSPRYRARRALAPGGRDDLHRGRTALRISPGARALLLADRIVPTPEGRVAAGGSSSLVAVALWLLPLTPRLLGLLWWVRRPVDPVGVLCGATVVGGLAGSFLTTHPGRSDVFFLVSAYPVGVVGSAAGLVLAGRRARRAARPALGAPRRGLVRGGRGRGDRRRRRPCRVAAPEDEPLSRVGVAGGRPRRRPRRRESSSSWRPGRVAAAAVAPVGSRGLVLASVAGLGGGAVATGRDVLAGRPDAVRARVDDLVASSPRADAARRRHRPCGRPRPWSADRSRSTTSS